MAFDIPRVTLPSQVGKRFRLLWIAAASLLVVLVGYNSCTTYVRPGEAGVKQIKFGMGKGIEPFVYTTGLHYVGAGETIHRFPMRVQVLGRWPWWRLRTPARMGAITWSRSTLRPTTIRAASPGTM